jgi:hypothetical protein
MFETWLTFVTLLALWKTFRVWRLKRKLANKEHELKIVRCEIEAVTNQVEKVTQSLTKYIDHFGPMPMQMGSTKSKEPIDLEWPELLS